MSVLALNDKIKAPEINKSNFDLSHNVQLAGKMGELIPILCEEVIPGDNWKITTGHIIRLMPLAGVINQRCDVYIHYFYVPNRIVWDEWEKFITGRSAEVIPTQNLATMNVGTGSLGDYYGIPYQNFAQVSNAEVNALPIMGYMKIYNDWYRNKAIQDEVTNLAYWSDPIIRNWRKDYLTSALPYPQLGSASRVNLDISYLDEARAVGLTNSGDTPILATPPSNGGKLLSNAEYFAVHNIDQTLSGIDVNDIRYAYAYQDWLVRMLQSGDDYADHLQKVFGVTSSDKRLQKVEYLGGYSAPIIVNDITKTSENYDSEGHLVGSPLATEAAKGYSYGDSDTITCYVEEHGYIHGIMSIIPKSLYYGGLPKHMKKSVPLDFYFPQFANLPEQEILKEEVYFDGGQAGKATWGYIERHAEYKHRDDRITGDVIKTFPHLSFAEITTGVTELTSGFLKAFINTQVFAITNDVHFYGQIGFNINANRPMPFNVDGLNLI